MGAEPLGEAGFRLGPLWLHESVVTTWGVMLALAVACALGTRRLRERPEALQVVLEGVVSGIESAIGAVLPGRAAEVLPFIGTLWIFLAVANLVGLIPGLHSPTADLSITSALAVLVFLAVHYYGIRLVGLRRYLGHYLRPSPLLLPFHLVSEVTRTVALAVRLFGNIMSLELAALLVLAVAGLLAPVPLLLLHTIEALVQAYIFGTLALVYIAGAVQSQELSSSDAKE